MSRQKITIVAILVLFCPVMVGLAQSTLDKVLSFYWHEAAASTKSRNPDAAGLSYSFVGHSIYKLLGDKGSVTGTDSLVRKYYFSFGNLDSTHTLFKGNGTVPDIDFSYPIVFDSNYTTNLFPNDTGGSLIAIGFDTDSANTGWPVGLTLLDRARYFPRWLYLYYPEKKGYRRFTRSFRIIEKDNFIFPDSVWEVGIVDALFFSTSYKLETGVKDITIYRK